MKTLFLSRITKTFSFKKTALYLGAAFLIAGGALPSCATAAGFGRDVEKVGDEIQHAAH